jgi:hypothetical protein
MKRLKIKTENRIKGGRGGDEYDLVFGDGTTYTSTSGCVPRISLTLQ